MDNQHIASNLTVRVSHDLLKAGAMCRVSNTLGVSEKHIQLVGECQALLSVPGAPSTVSPPPVAQAPAVPCCRGSAELGVFPCSSR